MTRYFTWKLHWNNNEGTDPTYLINDESTRVEPMFSLGDPHHPDFVSYAVLIRGDLDVSSPALAPFSMTEVFAEQVLTAAQTLDENATISSETGHVVFSFPPRAYPL